MKLLSPMVKEMKFIRLVLCMIVFVATSRNLSAQTAILKNFDFVSGAYTMLMIAKDDQFEYESEFYQDTFPVTYVDDPAVLQILQQAMVYESEDVDTVNYCNPYLTILICRGGTAVETISFSRQCSAVFAADQRFGFRGYIDSKVYPLADKRIELFPNLDQAHRILDSIMHSPDLIWFYEPDWTHFEGKFQFSQFNPELTPKDFVIDLERRMRVLYPDETFELYVTEDQSDDIQFSDQPKGHYVVEVTCDRSLMTKFDNRFGERSEFQPFVLVLESYWKRK
jgi:hypothetical protein